MKTTKNIIITISLISILLPSLYSCKKENIIDNKDNSMGYFSLNLSKSTQDIDIISKALTTISDTCNVVISNETSIILEKTYGELKAPFAIASGNYSIYAQNCTDAEALTGRGQQRFYGESTFIINPGHTTNVAFECLMQNSRISIELLDSFKQIFKTAKITAYENSNIDRKLIFPYETTHANNSLWAYFNIDNSPEIVLVIEVTRNDGQINNYTKTLSIQKKNWYKINVSSNNLNGIAGVNITVDQTLIDQNIDWGVEPY